MSSKRIATSPAIPIKKETKAKVTAKVEGVVKFPADSHSGACGCANGRDSRGACPRKPVDSEKYPPCKRREFDCRENGNGYDKSAKHEGDGSGNLGSEAENGARHELRLLLAATTSAKGATLATTGVPTREESASGKPKEEEELDNRATYEMCLKAWAKIDEDDSRKLRITEETWALRAKADVDAQEVLTQGCTAIKELSAKAGSVETMKVTLEKARFKQTMKARPRLEESDSITDAEEESMTSVRRRPACSTAPSNGVDTSPVERQLPGEGQHDGGASTSKEEPTGERTGCKTGTAWAPAGQTPQTDQELSEMPGLARQDAMEELICVRAELETDATWATAGQILEEERDLPETPDAAEVPICVRGGLDTSTARAPAGQTPQEEQELPEMLGPARQNAAEEPICVRGELDADTARNLGHILEEEQGDPAYEPPGLPRKEREPETRIVATRGIVASPKTDDSGLRLTVCPTLSGPMTTQLEADAGSRRIAGTPGAAPGAEKLESEITQNNSRGQSDHCQRSNATNGRSPTSAKRAARLRTRGDIENDEVPECEPVIVRNDKGEPCGPARERASGYQNVVEGRRWRQPRMIRGEASDMAAVHGKSPDTACWPAVDGTPPGLDTESCRGGASEQWTASIVEDDSTWRPAGLARIVRDAGRSIGQRQVNTGEQRKLRRTSNQGERTTMQACSNNGRPRGQWASAVETRPTNAPSRTARRSARFRQ
jgi:hypothetical protein